MAVITDIAEAVKDELNGGEFSQAFTAVRAYQPLFELKDMDKLHVTVVPRSIEAENAGRGVVQQDYGIDVAVQQRVDLSNTDALDGLMTLVEQIVTFFKQHRLGDVATAICVKAANEPVYSPDHMEKFRQFTSVIRLTFRVLR